jgi:hypothetical protein
VLIARTAEIKLFDILVITQFVASSYLAQKRSRSRGSAPTGAARTRGFIVSGEKL